MVRDDIIKELKEYFDIRELVCPDVFKQFGELSWQFFDSQFLETLLVVRRDIIKAEMTVNNWAFGGEFDERGLRCNICDIVRRKTIKNELYMSAHCNGNAIDATTKQYSAEQMRQLIIKNQSLLPYKIRLEKDVNWLHLDTYDNMGNEKVYLF